MWECKACGTQGIAGDLVSCPACSTPREAEAASPAAPMSPPAANSAIPVVPVVPTLAAVREPVAPVPVKDSDEPRQAAPVSNPDAHPDGTA